MMVYLSREIFKPDADVYRNDLKHSSAFGNAAWKKINITAVVSDVAPPPDYGPVAWLVTGLAGTLVKLLYQQADIAAVPGQWRCDWVVYAGTLATVAVVMEDGTGSNSLRRKFNVSTGAASGAGVSGGTATGADGEIVALGGGWYRVSAWGTFVSASTLIRAILYLDDYSPSATTGTIHVAACDLYRGITFRPHIETETVPLRSDQVIARAITPHNLIGYSNDLSNAAWSKVGLATISDTLTLSGSASNGWAGAVLKKLKEDTTTSSRTATQSSIAMNPAGLCTLRFLFASTNNGLVLGLYVRGSSTSHRFDYRFTTEGALWYSAITGNASLHSYSIVQVDTLTVDGVPSRPVWEVTVRGWADTTSGALVDSILFQLYDGWTSSWLGDGSTGIYVGKIQLVNGYDLPDYSETTTATSPFASNVSAATLNGVAAGVAKDAIIRNTEDQSSNTYWSQTNVHAIAAEGVSADGYPAYKLDCNTTAGVHSINATPQKTLTNDSAMTVFADLKADERTWARVLVTNKVPDFPQAYFNLSNGTIGASNGGYAPTASGIESRGSGWYRVRLVVTVGSGATTVTTSINAAESDGDVSFAGLGANDGILVSRCFAVEGNVAMADADAAYVKAGTTMEHVLDRSMAIVTLPGYNKFLAGQSHALTEWEVAQNVVITDGATTQTGSIEFEGEHPERYALTVGRVVYPAPETVVGDYAYSVQDSGDGVNVPAQMDFRAITESVIRWRSFGAAGWSSERQETIAAGGYGERSQRMPLLGIGLGIGL